MRVFLFISLFLLFAACQGAGPALSPKLESQKATLKKMSEALKKSGDMQSAAVIEQKLIVLDQRDEEGFADLAKTLSSIGKKDEARDVLKTGVEVVPASDKLKLELARSYLNDFDQKPALEVLGGVSNKESKDYYGLTAVAYDLDENNLQAKEFYRKGLEIEPKDENLRNNLAMSYILSSEYGDAAEILEELVKDPYVSNKYKPKYRQNLAMAYGLSGRNDKALKSLEKDLGAKRARENVEFYKRLSGLESEPKAAAKKTDKAKAKPAVKKEAVKAEDVKPEAERAAEPVVTDKPLAVETPVVKSETMGAPVAKTNLNKAKPQSRSTKSYLGQ